MSERGAANVAGSLLALTVAAGEEHDYRDSVVCSAIAYHTSVPDQAKHPLENVGDGVLCRPLGRVNLWQGGRSRPWVLELKVEGRRG